MPAISASIISPSSTIDFSLTEFLPSAFTTGSLIRACSPVDDEAIFT